jgi:uncharacterized RDD family membrane protein YckC
MPRNANSNRSQEEPEMGYYYADGNRRMGPVNKAQLMELVKNGKVTARTKVMESGSPGWEELGKLIARTRKTGAIGAAPMASAAPMPAPAAVKETAPAYQEPQIKKTPCSQCGVTFVHSELVRLNNQWLCPVCKVDFVQKMKEGVVARSDMRYAGFWIRFLALFIDGILMQVVNLIIGLPFIIPAVMDGENFGVAMGDVPAYMNLAIFAIGIAYMVFFVGRYGGTPGKLALGLRIVNEDGEKISYLRAFCRYLASFLSSLILGIGYLMAAFDGEKRALHDRICSTRVIRK